ncbi:MAG: metal-dependent hydrolase [Thermodesulfobacteriota bacterium]
MDPVTHIASGLLAGRLLADRLPSPRRALAFGMLAAWLPDVDSFVGLGPEQYLRDHRAFTHSLPGGALLALGLALAFTPLARQAGTRRLFLWGYGLVLLHVFLDLCTTYGTLALWPLSDARLYLPALFIVDPFLTLPLLTLLALTFLRKEKRRALAVLGLALCLAYPLANLGVRAAVTAELEHRLAASGVAFRKVELIPDLLAPLWWKAVVDQGDTLAAASVPALLPAGDIPLEAHRKADPALLARLGEQAPIFRTWSWFALYPVMRESPANPSTEMTFEDLRFAATSPLGRRLFPGYDPPFTLWARLNGNGRLAEYSFRGANGNSAGHLTD